jgi:hypothetical protein
LGTVGCTGDIAVFEVQLDVDGYSPLLNSGNLMPFRDTTTVAVFHMRGISLTKRRRTITSFKTICAILNLMLSLE